MSNGYWTAFPERKQSAGPAPKVNVSGVRVPGASITKPHWPTLGATKVKTHHIKKGL